MFVTRCAAWLSSKALDAINVVTLRRARLLPRWVTVFGRVSHLSLNHPSVGMAGVSIGCVSDQDYVMLYSY